MESYTKKDSVLNLLKWVKDTAKPKKDDYTCQVCKKTYNILFALIRHTRKHNHYLLE